MEESKEARTFAVARKDHDMGEQRKPCHGVMEGKGAYNQHARLPAGGAALALPLLEKAAQNVRLDPVDEPVVLADYGSSEGKNSLAPLRVTIQTLRSHLGPERSIFAYHIDQPANDFNSLFAVLDADPDSYARHEPNVFPCAIGRSFYEQVLPAESVHLGWSSYAAVWLSRVPGLIPGHFVALRSGGAARAAFASQAAQDWEAFLALRALELRPGGRLVVVLPALDEAGSSGFEDLMDHANEVLAQMVHEGVLLAEERVRMILGTYPRRNSELLAPFVPDGQFHQLVVEDCAFSVLEDAAWAEYRRDGDAEALAAKHALFFRSIFAPSLASALGRDGEVEERRAFVRQLEIRLKRRLASQPAALHSFVGTIVLAKRGST